MFNKRHVLILPSSEHPSANWGRSGEIVQGVTNFQNIPIYMIQKKLFKERTTVLIS